MEELRDNSSAKSVSKLKPPKIIIKRRPPTQIPQKKSCLKPSTSSASTSSSTFLQAAPGPSAGGSANSAKSNKTVQIKTSHNIVKLVKPNLSSLKQPKDSLTHTFRELFRDFPNSAPAKSASPPPPYRNPPPVLAGKRVPSYDEIEIDPSYGKRDNETLKKNSSFNSKKENEYASPSRSVANNYVIFKTITPKVDCGVGTDETAIKSEYSHDRLQNLPVKPRKTITQHMENYCLFDPSVDFINEKDEQKMLKIDPSALQLPTTTTSRTMLNYESVEPAGASSAGHLIAESDLYMLDSLADAMYGQSIGGLASLNRLNSAQSQCQFNDRYIQVIWGIKTNYTGKCDL